MDTSKLDICMVGFLALQKDFIDKQISIRPAEQLVANIDSLPEFISKAYARNCDIVQRISAIYGPDFMELQSRKPKPVYRELSEQYHVTNETIRNIMRKYLQSGLSTIALIDNRHFSSPKGYGSYNLKKKSGRKSTYIDCGKLLDDHDLQIFSDALRHYKSGRVQTIKKCFDLMNAEYYSRAVKFEDGSIMNQLLPVTERPTFEQFYYYVRCHLSQKEKDVIKSSKMEQRNNKRLLLSDSRYMVKGPGDRVQMDEVEVDVSLRSISDEIHTVGRPVVYIMHDVYTGIILALSIAFDNNSLLGMTNCFLNLAEDKVAFCKKYGITISEDMWPSNILPQKILVDRGSEYKSDEAARIFNELNIHRELAPAGTGSLKGLVEQFFHEMHSSQNPYLEGKGLIEKRFDSNHHEEASLTIDEFTRMLINFVVKRNISTIKEYPLTKDMIAKGIDPIPVQLWKYGCQKYGAPRPIRDKAQYMYTLMLKQTAVYSRKGIHCNGLYYFNPDDPQLAEDMYKAGNRRVSFEIRMDPRDIGSIYYLRNNKLQRAGLNSRKTGQADFVGMTLYEWQTIRHYLIEKRKKFEINNQQYDAYIAEINTLIVKSAQKAEPASVEGMERNRRLEKNIISSRLNMFSEINQYLEKNTGGVPDLSYDLTEETLSDVNSESNGALPPASETVVQNSETISDPVDDPNCPDPTKDIDAYMNYIIGKGNDYFL